MEVVFAALSSLTFRPLRPAPVEGKAFGAMAGSAYRNAVFVVLFMLAVEMPAVHLLLGVMMDEGIVRSIIQGVVLLSSLYLALWLLGDLRLLRQTPGFVVGSARLEVSLGQRARGEVPLSNVVRVRRLHGSSDAESNDAESNDDGGRSLRLTPLPAPNCRIWLRKPVTLEGPMKWPLYGDRLDVFVDDPDGLVAALQPAKR